MNAILEPVRTKAEVGRLLGITRARVYQIEQRALAKLRRSIERRAARAGVSVGEWLCGVDEDRRPAQLRREWENAVESGR